jgi:hypothetical protein
LVEKGLFLSRSVPTVFYTDSSKFNVILRYFVVVTFINVENHVSV